MTLKKACLIFAFMAIFQVIAYGQEGDYFITQHTLPDQFSDNQNFQVIQDQNGELWLANKQGLIRYDGREWIAYPTSSAVLSLSVSNDNILYFGGRGLFGSIDRSKTNSLKILEFDQIREQDIISIVSVKDEIFFCSKDDFYRYSPEDGSVERIDISYPIEIAELYNIEGDIFLRSESNGWFIVEGYAIYEANMPINIISISESAKGQLAILSDTGLIEITHDDDETDFLIFEDDNQRYLEESGPQQITFVNEEYLVVSTLTGGLIVIDIEQRKISEIINYYTGLPDNQVISLMVDNDAGIWALHNYGLSRISPLLPVRDYSKYPGLEGNVLKALKINNLTYAATSTGLFVLDEVRDYKEEIVYEKVIIPEEEDEDVEEEPETVLDDENRSEADEAEIVEADTTKKKKKGLFGFLKKKKKKDEEENEKETEDVTDEVPEIPEDPVASEDSSRNRNFFQRIFSKEKKADQSQGDTSNEEWVKRIERELLAVRFIYKPVTGIPAKVESLVQTERGVIAGGLSGAYEVVDSTATKIMGLPVKTIYYSSKMGVLFTSTLRGDNFTYKRTDDGWEILDSYIDIDQGAIHYLEFKDEYYLLSSDSLFHFDLDEEYKISIIKSVPIPNPYFEDSEITRYDQKLLVVNSSGLYEISTEDMQLAKWTNVDRIDQYFGIPDRGIWYRKGIDWYFVGDESYSQTLRFLNLFPDSRYITGSDKEDAYLIVTQGNNIYEVDASDPEGFSSSNLLFLKDVSDSEARNLNTRGKLKITQGFNSISFTFIKPDYTGLSNVSYRYRVKGLQKEWSEWSMENNTISISYLPSGKYELEAQSRNLMGDIENMVPYEFTVVPPYWRTAWFYAVEAIVFALLLYFSIRLNRTQHRFRFVSRLLAFLTLILVVEFIQTVAEYYFETETSPVFNFFIQVSVAFCVLPFESILRRVIFRTQPDSQ